MDEVKHSGILGMKWGRRKAQLPPVSIQSQAHHIARREAGIIATRELLRRYGKETLPVGVKALKGSFGLLKYSGRVAHGGAIALRLLGGGVKLAGRGGKAYVKGAINIAKVLR